MLTEYLLTVPRGAAQTPCMCGNGNMAAASCMIHQGGSAQCCANCYQQ